ncbi:MAG: FMN-binding protein [Firmicutes bacterium]|nr:FMN-binding protein [Bacillota bacterium]
MRDIVKMAVILLIIGAVCGGLLAAVHGFTTPIIEEREHARFVATLESFLPEVARYEEDVVDGESFYPCYDSAGNLIGVVGNVYASGYGGDIRYIIGVDSDGRILGVKIQEHGETPGIGDVITKDFFEQMFVGLSVEDPIAVGSDVDIVSGATFSSGGMISSVRRVMNLIGERYL